MYVDGARQSIEQEFASTSTIEPKDENLNRARVAKSCRMLVHSAPRYAQSTA